MFADLTRLLPDAAAQRLRQLYREPQQPGPADAHVLLEAFPVGRRVVLLDNLEDVIDPATLALRDAALDAALGELLAAPQHGIKVIVTTRLVPRELLLGTPGRQQRLDLDAGLPAPEAIKVMQAWTRQERWGSAMPPQICWRLHASGRGASRGRWRRWRRYLAADRDTSLPGCSPRRRCCRVRSSRSWSGRRLIVSIRSVSK